MPLRHIVAATSDTDEGRAAVQSATCLGQRVKAKVTVLAIANEPLKETGLALLTRSLRDTVARQLEMIQHPHPAVHFAVQFGLPGVEIGRFAESSDADLVVLGRKEHTVIHESRTGDTVDAVARRSRVPCLVVRLGTDRFDKLLVAVDGTERGLAVLHGAVDFARGTRARLRVVTVEPEPAEPNAPWVHTGRTERVSQAIGQIRRSGALQSEQWNLGPAHRSQPVLVRRGRVVEEVLNEAGLESPDVLVFGCHRGTPPASTDQANISRQLMLRSASAVLTIPL